MRYVKMWYEHTDAHTTNPCCLRFFQKNKVIVGSGDQRIQMARLEFTFSAEQRADYCFAYVTAQSPDSDPSTLSLPLVKDTALYILSRPERKLCCAVRNRG